MSLLKIADCYCFVNIWRSVASAEGLGSLGIYYALGLYTSFLTAPPGERVPAERW